ncbi:transmembrane protein 135, partial [Caerostris darwini]
MNGFLFMLFSCWYRKLMGGIFHFHSAYVPALVASFLAIFIERKNRRSALALYMTNLATESLIRMGLQRNLIKPFANAE